jgi:hypothetical protein
MGLPWVFVRVVTGFHGLQTCQELIKGLVLVKIYNEEGADPEDEKVQLLLSKDAEALHVDCTKSNGGCGGA